VKPPIPCSASAGDARLSRRPITTPISPSYSTCDETRGRMIGPPDGTMALGGLRKSIGRSGSSLPSSFAWAT
jgi:hypothetical protein